MALGLTKGGVAVKSVNCEFASPDEIRTALERQMVLLLGLLL